MNIDAHFVEASTALFQSRVVRSISAIDPLATVHVRQWRNALAMLSGARYPFNHVAGVFAGEAIAATHEYFRVHGTTLRVECAARTQTVQDLLTLRDVGLEPYPTMNVWTSETRLPSARHASSNLVWTTASDTAVAVDHLASDTERVLRHAYAMQPEATFVSILHGDGVIASAGIRIEDGYAFCFGGWIAPHRRQRAHFETLLDASLFYAAEHDCHSVVLHAHAHSAIARTAIERGFVMRWERTLWTAGSHSRGTT